MRKKQDIIKEILNKRGITKDEDIEEFLSVKPQETYNPFLLDGMQEGVDLLLSEIKGGSTVCIYGDYDADGVTSVCVMSCGIKALTDKWFYYIPSRFEEGYGLNIGALDKIKAAGADIVITVDCGCVSVREVEYAGEIGLKMIVTDHHTIEDSIADCIVINPKKPKEFRKNVKEAYPCPDLAGCGVAFKFLQALQRKENLPKSVLSDALDMVAVGTIGDIVKLRGENRTLVKYGIAIANSGRRKSLTHLAKAIALDSVDSENIAFGIVPHINATGRMESAAEAVELFISDDEQTIDERIKRLIQCNKSRKSVQEKAYRECLAEITGEDEFIILNPTSIHEGIAGIVAGKIKDKYNRPVIIVTPTDNGMLKGTGRSIKKINIYDILNNCSELFVRFGGHSSACGFLMAQENLEKLKESVCSQVRLLYKENPDLFTIEPDIDAELEPAEATVELAKELKQLAPFGQGNPPPNFRIKNAKILNLVYMGDDNAHARFLVQTESGEDKLNCVLFRKAAEMTSILEKGTQVDIIGNLDYQVWKGREKVQFKVEEII